MTWQTIDSAPDATPVLTYGEEDGIKVGFYYYGRWLSEGGDVTWAIYPTHWMELPEPPK